ncbi:MAG TPA: hypothetical protein VF857_10110, partial [Spirochaetota bacterium]
CALPVALWNAMRSAPVIRVELPLARRADYLLSVYGSFDPHELIVSTKKIERRFGPERTKSCIEAIESGDIRRAIEISLDYYDRGYDHGLMKRDSSTIYPYQPGESDSFEEIAQAVISQARDKGL